MNFLLPRSLTQELKLGLLNCRQILLLSEHQREIYNLSSLDANLLIFQQGIELTE